MRGMTRAALLQLLPLAAEPPGRAQAGRLLCPIRRAEQVPKAVLIHPRENAEKHRRLDGVGKESMMWFDSSS